MISLPSVDGGRKTFRRLDATSPHPPATSSPLSIIAGDNRDRAALRSGKAAISRSSRHQRWRLQLAAGLDRGTISRAAGVAEPSARSRRYLRTFKGFGAKMSGDAQRLALRQNPPKRYHDARTPPIQASLTSFCLTERASHAGAHSGSGDLIIFHSIPLIAIRQREIWASTARQSPAGFRHPPSTKITRDLRCPSGRCHPSGLIVSARCNIR